MPRTTIDLSMDNYDRLKSYCQRRHASLKQGVNQLIDQALNKKQPKKYPKKPAIPDFSVGVRIDPADRETLFNAMEQGL